MAKYESHIKRKKPRSKTRLYLDFYYKGKRKRQYLKLFLNPDPKTKKENEMNKKTFQLAEAIKGQI